TWSTTRTVPSGVAKMSCGALNCPGPVPNSPHFSTKLGIPGEPARLVPGTPAAKALPAIATRRNVRRSRRLMGHLHRCRDATLNYTRGEDSLLGQRLRGKRVRYVVSHSRAPS